jgi:hypothetical protein
MHLEIASENLVSIPEESYFKSQLSWQEEIREQFVKMKTDGTHLQRLDEEMVRRREEELRQVQDVRALYERKLETTQQLYNELSMCMEQLEVKQKELDRSASHSLKDILYSFEVSLYVLGGRRDYSFQRVCQTASEEHQNQAEEAEKLDVENSGKNHTFRDI